MQDHSWVKDRRIYPIFGILLLAHILLLLQTYRPANQAEITITEDEKPIAVKLSRDNLAHIKKQIVRSEESESDEKKDQAYLSDKTRSFDRESVAKRIDTFKPSAQGSPKKSITKRSEDIKLSDLGAYPKSENPFKKAAREYSKSKNGLVNGNPDVRGISSTNDYIKEVPAGDFTHLNTVEFKYYGFYHRIRQKLEQFWGRSIQEKAEILIKDGRRVPASEELITALQVTMDRDGEIIAIKVKGSSGVKELDDAAIESFNDAGPFPNPPKDLIVNGKVTVEWGFVVKS